MGVILCFIPTYGVINYYTAPLKNVSNRSLQAWAAASKAAKQKWLSQQNSLRVSAAVVEGKSN